MKPAPFDYHAPDTLAEALALLSRFGSDARPLAGGQSLIPVLNFRLARPAVLIDLNRIPDLAGVQAANGALHIGAMTRQSTLEREPAILHLAPLLADALPHVAHPQIRNRGTLGGSLAHADPAAELPAVMIAAGATFRLQSSAGSRRVAAGDFFTGLFATVLAPDELLMAIELPTPAPRSGYAFEEVARRHGDFALLGIAAALTLDAAGAVAVVRLVAINTAAGATRLLEAEQAIAGRPPDAASIADAVAHAIAEIDVAGDVHASPVYRRHLAGVLTRRALSRALSAVH
ncbi:MAG: FAD binding domain-containing protein [Gemmatimonadaceae bacterium]